MKVTRRRIIRLLAWLLLIAGVTGICYFAYISVFSPLTSAPEAKTPHTKSNVDGTKKTQEQLAMHVVPATHPRQLIIPTLGIDANILAVGIAQDGSLDAPKTAWDVGWYDQSSLPGTNGGAMIIDGHVNDSLDRAGVFARIGSLKKGAEIVIERGDGQKFSFRVLSTEQKPVNQISMDTLLAPAAAGKERLTLITCGGTYNPAHKTYDDRVLVYAEKNT